MLTSWINSINTVLGNNIFFVPILFSGYVLGFFLYFSYVKQVLLRLMAGIVFVATVSVFIVFQNIGYFLLTTGVGVILLLIIGTIVYFQVNKFKYMAIMQSNKVMDSLGKEDFFLQEDSRDKEDLATYRKVESLKKVTEISRQKKRKKAIIGKTISGVCDNVSSCINKFYKKHEKIVIQFKKVATGTAIFIFANSIVANGIMIIFLIRHLSMHANYYFIP